MAKEKVKQWVILIVVAMWLLTTLSACVGSQKVAHTNPDELWGTWACNKDLGLTFSQRTDASGVEVVVKESHRRMGMGDEESYIVDRKPHQLIVTLTGGSVLLGLLAPLAEASPPMVGPQKQDAFYAATSNLKTPEGHRIFRLVKRQGVSLMKGRGYGRGYVTMVDDYFVKNRHLYHRFWRVSSGGQTEWDNVDNFKPNDKSMQEKCVRER